MSRMDAQFSLAALEAAACGEGLASPNPLVGTVVVRDGQIVGRGFHTYDNMKHAEVVALEEAGERARGATVYVNLEPCSHFGRTPPCVDALIEAGVSRVVASMRDPAPYVDGRGFETLRAAGIEVEVGVERNAAERLNERYLTFIRTGRPFVLLKVAQTLDGRIATRTGVSKWITGADARQASQELRRRYDAILVGINTVLADDPDLTYRGDSQKRTPLVRAVIDSTVRLPLDSRLVATAPHHPLIVYTRERDIADRQRSVDALVERGVQVVPLPDSALGGVDLDALLKDMGMRKLHGLIVEGGAETSGAFVAARRVDKVTYFVAPKILGGRDAKGSVGGVGPDVLDDALELDRVETRVLGCDIEIVGYPVLASR